MSIGYQKVIVERTRSNSGTADRQNFSLLFFVREAGLRAVRLGTARELSTVSRQEGRVGERTTPRCGPLSPHRTGRADFPHPALRKALHRRRIQAVAQGSLQNSQPQFVEVLIVAAPFRRSEGPLAASPQMLRETIANVPVDLPEGHPRAGNPSNRQDVRPCHRVATYAARGAHFDTSRGALPLATVPPLPPPTSGRDASQVRSAIPQVSWEKELLCLLELLE